MARTFVMGDIHGAHRALKQCLERSVFHPENDRLIVLGDVCDGWPDTKACIDELLRIRNLTYILGNHDWWTVQWMTTGEIQPIWFAQGGEATILSYRDGVPPAHIRFLENALPYLELDNRIFVHAGFDGKKSIAQQGLDTFLWDRNLARMALELTQRRMDEKLTSYDEVYLGHTPISQPWPLHAGDVWLMDTGAGWSGVLSMMEINTKEVFVSDPVRSLYPGVIGRTRK
jgi:serine/threonine protein phosphatase 1